ncbi:MAG: hypothetical protein ACK6EB_19710 [Planctomyces sp.]
MQTDLQRCEWLRQHGWKVEGEAVIDGQPVRWIEHDKGNRTAWLRIVDGLILWHGAEDQEWTDFVSEQTKPAKPSQKLRTLFEFGDDHE